jgi:Ser/Thr protein kinase RdoA (MazF antagonist)
LTALDPGFAQARDVAQRLAGAGVEVRQVVAGGRNSRIYHVRQGEQQFALKQYPSRRDDPRDRLATEVGALRLMQQNRVAAVPRVVGVDRERNYALLTWIEGRQVASVDDADIDAAVAFLAAVHALRRAPGAAEQPPAAEACLSGREIERQISERLERLGALSGEEPELADFLSRSFAPAFDAARADARSAVRAAGLDFVEEVPQEWRSLIPADFGFHNSLRRGDGSLAFVDFEYFGWDDPVKLTADILLHPGRPLSAAHRRRFRQAVVRHYGEGRRFESRLAAYLPLFGLRWVLILLNEFIPERWRRRQLAGAGGSWSEAKARQLEVARSFLASLDQKVED